MWDEFFEEWFKRRPFSRILREMDRAFGEAFKDLSTFVPKELFRERKFPDGTTIRSFGPMVYGYSMTVGPDGKPQIRTFGNIRPEIPKPSEWREPLVDVIPSPTHVRVVVELPGIRKEDIDLRTTEESMTIAVDTPERKYRKEIELPAKVDPKSADATFQNGVLDVVMRRIEGRKPGESITIK